MTSAYTELGRIESTFEILFDQKIITSAQFAQLMASVAIVQANIKPQS